MLPWKYRDILTFHMVKDPVKWLLYNEKDLNWHHEIPVKVTAIKILWKCSMKNLWNFQPQKPC